MEIKKVNLDRQNLSSSYIEKKQDFNHVLKSAKMTKIPTWKSPWFYGAVGLSSVAIVAMVFTNYNIKKELDDKKATLKINNNPSKAVIAKNASKSMEEAPITQIAAAHSSTLQKEALSPNPSDLKIENVTIETKVDNAKEFISAPLAESTTQISKTPVKRQIGQPTINGIANGIIRVDHLKNSNLIESNSSFEITSYEVQYFNGRQDVVAQIRSNAIPEELKDQIIANNVGEMIFITGIKGLDENGKIVKLPSINLKLSK
jgi:hypothetical protein